jgi:ferrous iron transport protein B
MTPATAGPGTASVALVGHPNTGRTTLFNRLCGVRARTANCPGTTCDVRLGRCAAAPGILIADLPGIYGLDLDQPESRICREYLESGTRGGGVPGAVLAVADACSLARTLAPAGEALRRRLPVIVAVNKIDLARRRGLHVDAGRLQRALGMPVVAVSARGGENLGALTDLLASPEVLEQEPPAPPPDPAHWAAQAAASCLGPEAAARERDGSLTDRIDTIVTHPFTGTLVFAGVMAALFMAIFSLAELPMAGIELASGGWGAGCARSCRRGRCAASCARGSWPGSRGPPSSSRRSSCSSFSSGCSRTAGTWRGPRSSPSASCAASGCRAMPSSPSSRRTPARSRRSCRRGWCPTGATGW